MSIPLQVQQQHERVAAMMRGDVPAEQADTPVVEQATSPEPEAPPQPSPEQASGQDDAAQLRAALDKSEQRYRTLDGMIRQKDNTIRQMETLLAQMQQQPKEAEPAKEVKSADESADRAEFGDDFVDMVNRAVARHMRKLEARLDATENVAKESYAEAAHTKQSRFYAALEQRVPGWRDLDNSPEFAAWLQQSHTKIAIVQQAMSKYDVDAIAELFEHYKVISGTGRAAHADAPAKPPLGRKVAPSKGVPSGEAPSTEKRMWKRSEIASVYQNRRNYSQKDFDQLQRDIFDAQKEGRVDYSK